MHPQVRHMPATRASSLPVLSGATGASILPMRVIPPGVWLAGRRRVDILDYKLALLDRVPLFGGLPQEELERIAKIVDEEDVPAGTVLTHEGRQEGYFYIIMSGTVVIERGGQTVNTIGDGDFLGEIALLDGGPRTATATTQSDARLLTVRHQRFQELLDASPRIRRAVLEEVGERLRRLDSEVVT